MQNRATRKTSTRWTGVLVLGGVVAVCGAALAFTSVSRLPEANPIRAAEERGEQFAVPGNELDRGALTRLITTSLSSPTDDTAGEPARRGDDSEELYDAAIAELIAAATPRRSELQPIETAVEATFREDHARARQAAAQVSTPHARTLLTWYGLRSGKTDASAVEIIRFARDNPDWPQQELRASAETALLVRGATPTVVRAFFQDQQPETSAGKAALATALLARGDRAGATELAREAWWDRTINRDVEKTILDKLGSLLTEADHRRRADLILLHDSRWRATRNVRVARARRVVALLSEPEQRKMNARIKVYQRQRGSTRALADLGPDRLSDWGVYHHHIQQLRRDDKDREAWDLLLKAPTETDKVVSPDDWWIERRVNAYAALYAKEHRIAYDLVADPGDVSVNPRNESSFMAGWIALRFLNDAPAAERHFRAMTETADGPRTRSTSAYWMGRTLAAQGNEIAARGWYGKAAREFNTFYGQIARQTLDPDARSLDLPLREPLAEEVIRRFSNRDVIKAVVAASKANLTNVTRRLLIGLRRQIEDPAELALLAHLATRLGDTQMGVRIGKAGLLKGWRLAHWAYPIHAMPDYQPLRQPIERAILFAIARQESEFNTLIQSGAGAQGILQVMQITAKHVCRQYSIRCRLNALKSDPSYNAQLASAYIADRHDEFSGSYIMTFAGYNAGPGRVRYWLRNIGDPRTNVDPIDWVELVHIRETREYMKKVLANVQVYRARLGAPETALQIRADLDRARRGG